MSSDFISLTNTLILTIGGIVGSILGYFATRSKSSIVEVKKIENVFSTIQARILIVDDDPTLALTIKDFINGDYILVVEVRPFKALALICMGFDHIPIEQFDLILLDYKMPLLNGIEFAKHVRRYEKESKSKRSKIAIITGYGDKIDRPVEVDEIFSKGKQITQLADKVKKLLEKR